MSIVYSPNPIAIITLELTPDSNVRYMSGTYRTDFAKVISIVNARTNTQLDSITFYGTTYTVGDTVFDAEELDGENDSIPMIVYYETYPEALSVYKRLNETFKGENIYDSRTAGKPGKNRF